MVLWLLRGAWFALAAGTTVFALASSATGPVASVPWALAVGACTLLAAAAAFAVGVRGLPRRGPAVLRLVEGVAPGLASPLRTAIELADDPSPLQKAHRRRVEAKLTKVDLRAVVPWHWLQSGAPIAALLWGMAMLVFIAAFGRTQVGAFALLHPGSSGANGIAEAHLIGDVEVELNYPRYMSRSPETKSVGTLLEAPRGTTVIWRARPRLELANPQLRLGDDVLPLAHRSDGRLEVRFVLRDDASLAIDAHDAEGRSLRDGTPRRVLAIEDPAPTVTIEHPKENLVLRAEDEVLFRVQAEDNIAVAALRLVLEDPAGEVHPQDLGPFLPSPYRESEARIHLSDHGLRPGDRIRVWFEADDGDVVSGPNTGQSPPLEIEILSDAQEREALLSDLRTLLDASLGALADRLEAPVPDALAESEGNAEANATPEDPARQRFERVQRSAHVYRELLEGASRVPERALGAVAPAVYGAMAHRLHRSLTGEIRHHGRRIAPTAARRRSDGAIVALLEEQALFLEDQIGHAHLDDAASIARELERLRREMTSLLGELRRADTPEARRQLNLALHRARQRLRELQGRLADMGDDLPEEFVNREALPGSEETLAALVQMEQALENGDLEAAERALMSFEEEVQALAAAFQQAEGSFAESRFGPRERALAEAMDRLGGLEREQRQLARRSEELRQQAAERALAGSGSASRGDLSALAEQASQAAAQLAALPREALGPLDRESLDQAQQRFQDAADALGAGDLGEAHAMSTEGSLVSERLARDLEISALMFPGRDGRVGDAARSAREASEAARQLQRGLDRALPKLRDHLRSAERQQLQGDANRQGDAAQATSELSEAFDAEPDGAPLQPETAAALREVEQTMRNAGRALGTADPLEASQHQRDAARRLTELREELETQQQQQQDGGGGGGDSAPSPGQRIEIPGQGGEGPQEERRRILDAMRRRAPSGYEGATERYYEGLLR